MISNHMLPDRTRDLVFNGKHMSLRESHHISSCASCHGWLMAFVKLARHANLNVSFKSPRLVNPIAN
jgi:hypothetical protein